MHFSYLDYAFWNKSVGRGGGGIQQGNANGLLIDLLVVDKMKLYYSDDIITNPAQDLHENLLCIGDATFPGLSNQLNYIRTRARVSSRFRWYTTGMMILSSTDAQNRQEEVV